MLVKYSKQLEPPAAWSRHNPFKAAIKKGGTGAKNASLVAGIAATTLKTISVVRGLL